MYIKLLTIAVFTITVLTGCGDKNETNYSYVSDSHDTSADSPDTSADSHDTSAGIHDTSVTTEKGSSTSQSFEYSGFYVGVDGKTIMFVDDEEFAPSGDPLIFYDHHESDGHIYVAEFITKLEEHKLETTGLIYRERTLSPARHSSELTTTVFFDQGFAHLMYTGFDKKFHLYELKKVKQKDDILGFSAIAGVHALLGTTDDNVENLIFNISEDGSWSYSEDFSYLLLQSCTLTGNLISYHSYFKTNAKYSCPESPKEDYKGELIPFKFSGLEKQLFFLILHEEECLDDSKYDCGLIGPIIAIK